MASHRQALENKKTRLFNDLQKLGPLAVAFSGGVDSTLLLAAAHHVLGDRVIAITAASAAHSSGELEIAVDLAREMGVRHVIIETDELEDSNFVLNGPDRCYFCKKRLFNAMIDSALQDGVQVLAHGINLDDLDDFRPGLKAAEEMGIVAPLAQSKISKSDVRQIARQMGLPNWDRPAMACLATRIPYGTMIRKELLIKIDQAEQAVRQLGVRHCRVRHYGNMARIEVGADEIEALAKHRARERIIAVFKGLGYQHVSLDLEGYQTGKMNRDLAG